MPTNVYASRMWRSLRVLSLITLAAAAWGQTPSFRAEDVRPQGAADPHPLRPGMGVWIFGKNLGPSSSCTVDNGMDSSTYVEELCGVRVLFGGSPAPLIYVSSGQINLVMPDHPWEDEDVDVRVVRGGVASATASVRFGFAGPRLSLDGPAYAGMPVWLRVELPWGHGRLRYPFHTEPWDMGSVWLEARHEGETLAPLPLPMLGPNGDGMSVGLPAEPPDRLLDRLPLHLLYALDRPGSYQVRYLELRSAPGRAGVEVRRESDWINFQLRPSTQEQRRTWFEELIADPPASVSEIVGAYLPAVLARRDEHALRALGPYLDHPNLVVRRYAGYGLYYFDEALRERTLPGRTPPAGFIR